MGARSTARAHDRDPGPRGRRRESERHARGLDGRITGRGERRRRPAEGVPDLPARPGRDHRAACSGAARAHGGCRERATRPLAARPGRVPAALRAPGLTDHAGGARPRPSRDSHLQRSRARRSRRDDSRGRQPARLPRLDPLAEGQLVHRPVEQAERRHLHRLLHARPAGGSGRTVRVQGGRRRGARRGGGRALDQRRRPLGGRRAAHVPARADHRPVVLHLLRRPRERDRGQGRADEPCQPGLRGRDLDPARPDQRHRQDEPEHRRGSDSAERPLWRCRLLHSSAARLVRQPRPHPDRARPDHRRLELRHRAPRPRQERRRRREPRCRRRQPEGAGLHRPAEPGGRLLRRRLRGARDGPPVRRQPHLQRGAAELLRRQPQRDDLRGTRQRDVDHGVRGDLPAGQHPAAQRPVLVAAQLRGDHELRHLRAAADQRGADGLAA